MGLNLSKIQKRLDLPILARLDLNIELHQIRMSISTKSRADSQQERVSLGALFVRFRSKFSEDPDWLIKCFCGFLRRQTAKIVEI